MISLVQEQPQQPETPMGAAVALLAHVAVLATMLTHKLRGRKTKRRLEVIK